MKKPARRRRPMKPRRVRQAAKRKHKKPHHRFGQFTIPPDAAIKDEGWINASETCEDRPAS